jgi:hypothetical protein
MNQKAENFRLALSAGTGSCQLTEEQVDFAVQCFRRNEKLVSRRENRQVPNLINPEKESKDSQ